MHSRPKCLVVGSSNTALQVGRALGREGIEVHYLSSASPGDSSDPRERSSGEIGNALPRGIRAISTSNYCAAVHTFDPRSVGYAETIERLSRKLDNPVILLTSDEFLMLHASVWKEVSAMGLRAPLPAKEALLDALDKARTFRAALRHDVGVPRTIALDRAPGGLGGLKFPVIIKPRTSAGKFAKLGAKAFICRDEAELDQAGGKAFREWGPMIMQEYVPGPCTRLWKYNAVLDRDHRPVAEFCFQKIAQFPTGAGVACISRSAHRPDLLQVARRLMAGMEWVGAVNMEFKEDPRGGQLKLMEINPRPYLGIGQPLLVGVNLPLALYELAIGGRIPLGDYPDDHYFVNPFLLASMVKETLLGGSMSTAVHALRHLFHARLSLDVWAFDDPGPFLVHARSRLRDQLRAFPRPSGGRSEVAKEAGPSVSPQALFDRPSEAGK
jgi:D-aspartate ligase